MKRPREALSDILKSSNFSRFEKKVYRAVSKIPPGEVRSYKWVAETTGHPKACRAVGNALNKNPHAVTIPCHRVIKSDSSIGGYAKGVGLKKRLLKREGLTVSADTVIIITKKRGAG